MNSSLAYCGLVCETCPIHLLGQESDPNKRDAIRAEVIRVSREHYGAELLPAEINDCDGCRADTGRLFSACLNCPIRRCARDKRDETCAHCSEYSCENLERFFAVEPAARERLDRVRTGPPVSFQRGAGPA